MRTNIGIHKERSSGRALGSLIVKAGLSLALGAAAMAAPAAWAGWNSSQETINNHPTWIYTPGTALPNGKRALVVALHGCDQTNTQLKDWGNLTTGANARGAVIAVPYVGTKVWPGNSAAKCWDYHNAADGSGHIAELQSLTQNLINRSALNIDTNHVYIIGLSSGGAMALDVACKAPDLFAGVSAQAGPSVGSSQYSALSNAGVISYTPAAAVQKCKSLAGTAKLAHFDTQIANVAYGEKDRDAESPGCNYTSGSTSCPGTYLLVSKKWSTINADAFKLLYGTGSLGTPLDVANGTGKTSTAAANGATRLSFTRIHNVGHAWPAGTGQANSVSKGGVWMAQSGMDFTSYVVGWLIDNNIRKPQGPVVTSCKATVASSSATSATISGTGEDQTGTIVGYNVKLTGPSTVNNTTGSGNSFSKNYGLANGSYTGTVTATNNTGAVSGECVINTFVVGPPPPILPPTGLTITGSTGSTISMTWNAVSGATGYNVYRGASKVTAAPVTATSYTDTGLTINSTYNYAVKSVNASGESTASSSVPGTTTSGWNCTATTASHYAHVQAGRAYVSGGYAYANGSNQKMGLYNLFYTKKLAETSAGYYIIGSCP